MGVGAAALAVLGALGGGAALTAWLEPRWCRHEEPGPAAALRLTPEPRFAHADRWLYLAAPVLALMAVVLATVVVPFGPGLVGEDLGIGVFYFLVVVDFVVLGLTLGGWGADTGQAIEVYYRATAQLVAYVVPLGLAYIGAIMMAGSLSTVDIVDRQRTLWYVLAQPVGFVLYLVTGLMQAYRAPFLEPFARGIEHGVLGVVGGWKALFWRVAMSGLLFLVAAMGAVLYLGGWHGPWLPPPLWMLLKTFALMAAMLWLGRTIRPLDTAAMLALSWKVLTPLGLLNVLIVGALILAGVGQEGQP